MSGQAAPPAGYASTKPLLSSPAAQGLCGPWRPRRELGGVWKRRAGGELGQAGVGGTPECRHMRTLSVLQGPAVWPGPDSTSSNSWVARHVRLAVLRLQLSTRALPACQPCPPAAAAQGQLADVLLALLPAQPPRSGCLGRAYRPALVGRTAPCGIPCSQTEQLGRPGLRQPRLHHTRRSGPASSRRLPLPPAFVTSAENTHVKSIVRCACAVESSTDPHHFLYKPNPECMPGAASQLLGRVLIESSVHIQHSPRHAASQWRLYP